MFAGSGIHYQVHYGGPAEAYTSHFFYNARGIVARGKMLLLHCVDYRNRDRWVLLKCVVYSHKLR